MKPVPLTLAAAGEIIDIQNEEMRPLFMVIVRVDLKFIH